MFLSIRNKILISHFGIVIFVAITIGLSGFYLISNHVNIDEKKYLKYIASTLKFRIQEVFERKKSLLQRMLEGKELDIYTEKYNEPVLTQYLNKYSKEFPVLSYVNTKGEEEKKLVNGIVSKDNQNIRDSSIFREIMLEPDKIITSKEHNIDELGEPVVSFAITKYNFFGDQVVGFIKGCVPLSNITSGFSEVEVGETGFILLIGGEDKIIYYDKRNKDLSKMIQKVNNSLDLNLRDTLLSDGIARTTVLGIDSIVAIVPIEEVMWSLMVVVPYKEFTAEANKIKSITIGVLSIVLIISGVIFTFITNNITDNIIYPLKRFVSFTDLVARGDYSQITDIRSTDEIGILANSFNNMLKELKKTRDDLILAKEYADNIIESMPNAVIVLTEKAFVEKVNRSVYNMLGRTEEEILNKHISILFEENIFTDVWIGELIQKGFLRDIETELLTKYSIKIPVVFSASVMFDDSGKVKGIVCSAQNITQQKRMQEDQALLLRELEITNSYLKQSQAQLVQSEKMAALGQLVAGIAHEINTPIGVGVTAASNFLKLTQNIRSTYESKTMKKSDFEDYMSDSTETCDLILRNLQRSAELIRSFKMVAVDQTTHERRRFVVKDYLQDIVMSLRPKLKAFSHKIEIDVPSDLEIDNYPGAFAQVLTNLLINSLIHAYNEGEEGHIKIIFSSIDDKFVLKYIDDGKGIAQGDLHKIFDPFFTTKRNEGGSGLGLNIVYNIVHQVLKGSITCHSVVGQGTTFTMTIPSVTGERREG
ncbi:MAG: PAS domain-containing protein [Nitrospirae bacterium]|nr:PAS domain-containing protein [Nitrospirota bacterium]